MIQCTAKATVSPSGEDLRVRSGAGSRPAQCGSLVLPEGRSGTCPTLLLRAWRRVLLRLAVARILAQNVVDVLVVFLADIFHQIAILIERCVPVQRERFGVS